MAIKPNITVSAQASAVAGVPVAAQSKVVAVEMQKKIRRPPTGGGDEAAETIYIPNPGSQDRNDTLLERGVSVVRPEIIAATEFIPLIKDDDPSDATFTMVAGDSEYKIDITTIYFNKLKEECNENLHLIISDKLKTM